MQSFLQIAILTTVCNCPTSIRIYSDHPIFQLAAVALAAGPSAVPLGTADTFVILAKSGVSTVPPSSISRHCHYLSTSKLIISALAGNVGVSPSASSSLTGFSLTKAGTFGTSTQVTGELFASDFAVPTPAQLTTAVANMQTAFTNATGRVNPNFLNLSSGKLILYQRRQAQITNVHNNGEIFRISSHRQNRWIDAHSRSLQVDLCRLYLILSYHIRHRYGQ